MSIKVYYDGDTLIDETANCVKRLDTKGKYLEDDVTIDYSGGTAPTLISKSINENGIYNASSDNADGYSSVSVNVPSPPSIDVRTLTQTNTIVTVGANSINNVLDLALYFLEQHKMVIATRTDSLPFVYNDVTYVTACNPHAASSNGNGNAWRYRNGFIPIPGTNNAYDAVLTEGSIWEVKVYD